MILSILAILITLGIGYAWFTRGFYSAALNLMCVITAGVVAFAAWEPLAFLMIDKIEYKEGVMGFLQGSAMGLSLILPFALTVGVLRVATDSVLKANMKIATPIDRVGGGICGLGAGVIASGVLVLGTGFYRLPSSFQGYQPIQVADQGNLQRKQSLLFPVDEIVAGLYSGMSQNVLATGTPLARYYPDLPGAAGTQRMSYGAEDKTQARNTLRSGDVTMKLRYGVGDGSQDNKQLFMDRWSSGVSQTVVDLDGNPYPQGTTLEGYVLEFTSGALEDFGQFVITHPQVRLLAENAGGEIKTIHPIAFVNRTKAGSNDNRRFMIQSGGDVIASVGASSAISVAFEFPMPPGFSPYALYVRNQRIDISGEPEHTFATTGQRDDAVQSTRLLSANVSGTATAAPAQELDTSDSQVAARSTGNTSQDQQSGAVDIKVTSRLPGRIAIQKGQERTLEVNEDNEITGGETQLGKNTLNLRPPPELRVGKFSTLSDVGMVQLEVGGDPAFNKASLLGRSVQAAQRVLPPQLIDAAGRRYDCVGFVYRDRDGAKIRYTPSRPLRALSEAEDLSSSRDDQEMWLLFLCDVGVDIERFVIGQKEVLRLDSPLKVSGGR